MNKIVVLIHCRDQKGIIAAVTNYIASIEDFIMKGKDLDELFWLEP